MFEDEPGAFDAWLTPKPPKPWPPPAGEAHWVIDVAPLRVPGMDLPPGRSLD